MQNGTGTDGKERAHNHTTLMALKIVKGTPYLHQPSQAALRINHHQKE